MPVKFKFEHTPTAYSYLKFFICKNDQIALITKCILSCIAKYYLQQADSTYFIVHTIPLVIRYCLKLHDKIEYGILNM